MRASPASVSTTPRLRWISALLFVCLIGAAVPAAAPAGAAATVGPAPAAQQPSASAAPLAARVPPACTPSAPVAPPAAASVVAQAQLLGPTSTAGDEAQLVASMPPLLPRRFLPLLLMSGAAPATTPTPAEPSATRAPSGTAAPTPAGSTTTATAGSPPPTVVPGSPTRSVTPTPATSATALPTAVPGSPTRSATPTPATSATAGSPPPTAVPGSPTRSVTPTPATTVAATPPPTAVPGSPTRTMGPSATATVTPSPAPNLPPTAMNCERLVLQDATLLVDLRTTASDPNGDALSFTLLTLPTHGSALLQAATLVYTPTASFTGTDAVRYGVSDGRGGSAAGTVVITVVGHAAPPEVTMQTPSDGAVLSPGAVTVTGQVSGSSPIASVTVNGQPATLSSGQWSATVPTQSGNQTLTVIATDTAGAVGTASRVVAVDGEGPTISITAPRARQAVTSAQPAIAVSYRDARSPINPQQVVVTLTNDQGQSSDLTPALQVTTTGITGQVPTVLAEDRAYTLTVRVADQRGNQAARQSTFFVPAGVAAITPPVHTDTTGWVSGVVYDSQRCDDDLHCPGLAGVAITLETLDPASRAMTPLTGTVVTGPDGFYAYPVATTGSYAVRYSKPGYTIGQREVTVVAGRSTATTAVYLTALDPARTPCDDLGCTHLSADGQLKVEVPADALAAGTAISLSATNFRHVEFLPNGDLPPGTAETYAFNITAFDASGQPTAITFTQPITLSLRNYRGFAAGEHIPLGGWNPYRAQWEHVSDTYIDASGQWVVMPITQYVPAAAPAAVVAQQQQLRQRRASASAAPIPFIFFPPWMVFDPNYPISRPNGGGKIRAGGGAPNPCPASVKGCVIDVKAGRLREQVTLPAVTVLGGAVAPTLRYNTSRAQPVEVVDTQFSLNPDPGFTYNNYLRYELLIEGQSTGTYVIANTLTPGQTGRFRYLWDGRDAQGNPLPPGLYSYAVKISVPYVAQYCAAQGFFGSPCSGRFLPAFTTGFETYWTSGVVALTAETSTPLGTGWKFRGPAAADERCERPGADRGRRYRDTVCIPRCESGGAAPSGPRPAGRRAASAGARGGRTYAGHSRRSHP